MNDQFSKPRLTDLKCQICSQQFTYVRFYKKHMFSHNNKCKSKLFRCQHCPSVYKRPNDLSGHVQKVHTSKTDVDSIKCPICSKQFSGASDFEEHMSDHDERQCNICLKHFDKVSYLYDHMIVHNLDKPFKCQICLVTFKSKAQIDLHMKTHQRFMTEVTKCNVCSESFQSHHLMNAHIINAHIEICEDNRSFKCMVCDKISKTNHEAIKHMRMHKDDGKFKCYRCEKVYHDQRSLSEHYIQTHKIEKRFECQICEKAFVTLKGLRKHASCHPGVKKVLPCEECGNGLVNKHNGKN